MILGLRNVGFLGHIGTPTDTGYPYSPAFNEEMSGTTEALSTTVTVTTTMTFRFVFTISSNNNCVCTYRIAGGSWVTISPSTNVSASINNGQTLQFRVTVSNSSAHNSTISVRNNANNSEYQLISVVLSGEDCFLTTTMVNYFGYADDGPELSAMRTLRAERGHLHKKMLEEYSEYSKIIVDRINLEDDPGYWYNLIKQTVDNVVLAINDYNIEYAEEIYINLYSYLKEVFMKN